MKKITHELLRVKKELFLKESATYIDKIGYKNFKISDLAKQLETSVGTLYNLFTSKEELYLEYLIFKLQLFLEELTTKETPHPMDNLRLYLQCKYAIFIQIDKNSPLTSDPFFFHKLDIANHPIVLNIYAFLMRQLQDIFNDPSINLMHQAILFKKFSDGFIESYLLEKYDTSELVEKTLRQFFEGAFLYKDEHKLHGINSHFHRLNT